MAAGMIVADQRQRLPHARRHQSRLPDLRQRASLYQNSTVNMADITDGTSSTIIMGESIYPAGSLVAGHDLLSFGPISTEPSTSRSSSTSTASTTTYWSYWASKHPSAVNFAFCDGSVRPVTSQINKLVLNKMCTRNGGETISSDEMK